MGSLTTTKYDVNSDLYQREQFQMNQLNELESEILQKLYWGIFNWGNWRGNRFYLLVETESIFLLVSGGQKTLKFINMNVA